MLAGEQPFTGPTAQAILVRRLTETPRPIRAARDTVSARVDAVIARALSRTPADRQQTVSQFASDLRAATSASPNVSARANMRWAVVGAVAASMLLVLFFRQQLGLSPSPALAPAIVRLAVLPLENLGAEGDAQFVDGMTDEIMSRLAEIGALKVVSRTSARSFRGASLSMREVGARLNADYVLEGTVRTDRAANGVTSARVTPRLVRVRDDAPLWTQSFDTALIPGELLRVQADIATRVADALNLKLGNHELRRVNRVMTRDSAAYRSYQLGRFQWQKRERESLERAADHFRDAVARDSQFADAYAGLSDAQGAYIALYGDTRAHDRQREASAAARRAVAIDSALAVGHASLGFCRFFLEWDWDGAETALRRSIALDAAYAPARYWLTQLLWLRGRYDEALEQARAAVLADPLSAVAYLARARSLRLLDREEEWVGDLRHAIELQPRLPVSWLDLAIYHARRGAPDSVRTASARFLEYRSESGRAPAGASDALTRALMGTASVAAFLRTVPSDSATDWSWLAVQLYAMRGESDSAFSKLRKLESSRGIDFPTTAPFLAGYLGGDARWRTVRKRLGL